MNEDLTRDIYQRLGGIEAKLDDVRQIRDTANEAEKKAELAQKQSEENSRNIDKLSSTLKWAFGIIVTIVVPLGIAVLNLFIGG